MHLTDSLLILVSLVLSAVIGAVAYAFWSRHEVNTALRLPANRPLTTRGLLTNNEDEVFKWLLEAFHDHLIMVKLPVLRFTMPADKDKSDVSRRWQELLGGVYSTFTICTYAGDVVGCVDVVGKRGLAKANRELKESLLAGCNIGYTAVRSGALPKVSAMRAAFLGEVKDQEQLGQAVNEEEYENTRTWDRSFNEDEDIADISMQKQQEAKQAALQQLNKAVSFNPNGRGIFQAPRPAHFPQ